MPIPEAQLETWTAIGASKQSRDTYGMVKYVLDHEDSPYYQKSFESFLQGSYGNDTNVVGRDSDVDIVLRLDSAFQFDIEELPEPKQQQFHREYGGATYGYADFKADVISWIEDNYPGEVEVGGKAIRIAALGNRRDTDVLPCMSFRRYYRYYRINDEDFAEGICFWDQDGDRIVNYPKLHLGNCTNKHQNTAQWYKRMVRIVKNMRNRMVDQGYIADDLAPSYFLEGLFYNVPNHLYTGTYASAFLTSIRWIIAQDRSEFVCANEQYMLLHPSSKVTWRAEKCDEYLDKVLDFWNDW